MQAYIITEKYFKERTSQHAEDTDIKVAFENVTYLYIKPLLGVPLYDLYLKHVQEKTTLTAKQIELFERVKIYFVNMTHFELMFNLFEITAKGNQVEPNSASIEVVKLKRTEVFNKAEIVKGMIVDYLNKNKVDFPEYYSPDGLDSEQPQSITSTGLPFLIFDEPKQWIGR